MNLKKIKCIILDFDDTLYSNGNWSGFNDYMNRYFLKENILSEFETAGKKIRYLVEKYPNLHSIQGTFAYLHENMKSDISFREFLNENIYDVRSKDTEFLDAQLLKNLAQFYSLYIISDSSVPYIEFYLKEAGIDKNNFVEILSNSYSDECYTKIPMMKKVLEATGLKPDEIIMIGDSENADIKPAKLVGFQTYHVSDVNDTAQILKSILNLK